MKRAPSTYELGSLDPILLGRSRQVCGEALGTIPPAITALSPRFHWSQRPQVRRGTISCIWDASLVSPGKYHRLTAHERRTPRQSSEQLACRRSQGRSIGSIINPQRFAALREQRRHHWCGSKSSRSRACPAMRRTPEAPDQTSAEPVMARAEGSAVRRILREPAATLVGVEKRE